MPTALLPRQTLQVPKCASEKICGHWHLRDGRQAGTQAGGGQPAPSALRCTHLWEVLLDPVERRLLDAVLPRGDDHEVAERAQPCQAVIGSCAERVRTGWRGAAVGWLWGSVGGAQTRRREAQLLYQPQPDKTATAMAARTRDRLDACRKVVALKELVHQVVGVVLAALPNLCVEDGRARGRAAETCGNGQAPVMCAAQGEASAHPTHHPSSAAGQQLGTARQQAGMRAFKQINQARRANVKTNLGKVVDPVVADVVPHVVRLLAELIERVQEAAEYCRQGGGRWEDRREGG